MLTLLRLLYRYGIRTKPFERSDPNPDIYPTRAKKADARGSFLDKVGDGRVDFFHFATVCTSQSPPIGSAKLDKVSKCEYRKAISSSGPSKFVGCSKEKLCHSPGQHSSRLQGFEGRHICVRVSVGREKRARRA